MLYNSNNLEFNTKACTLGLGIPNLFSFLPWETNLSSPQSYEKNNIQYKFSTYKSPTQ